MRLYHHHFALLSLLQCQSTTNVTIAVQLVKQKTPQKNPHQNMVNSSSVAEIPRLRKNRGSMFMVASSCVRWFHHVNGGFITFTVVSSCLRWFHHVYGGFIIFMGDLSHLQ